MIGRIYPSIAWKTDGSRVWSYELDPTIFPPGVGSSLAVIIQGLVILFVGADVLVLVVLARLRRARARSSTV